METHFPGMESGQSRAARERVLTDLKTLVRDAEELLRVTANDASELAKEARARVATALEHARASCQAMQAQSVESARAVARKADDTVRTHPYETIGVAFGVGVLLGVLLRRR